MIKIRISAVILLLIFIFSMCSCFRKPIDTQSGFSTKLNKLEESIRNENWETASSILHDSTITWKKIKPLLQINIDHDYINDIEKNFIKLRAYIDTGEKASSLVSILLIQDSWENIESL